VVLRVDFYSSEELKAILFRSAEIMKIPVEEAGILEIARRSRGTPRVANRILRRVRDFAQVKAMAVLPCAAWSGSGPFGLDKMDRKILLTIIEKFSGPVGVEAFPWPRPERDPGGCL
jgi:Holliday junction DNA helicase RuvB